MSDNSLTAAISLGVQSGKGSAATAYKTALATDSSGNVKFDTRDPKLEHPSAIARSTKVKIAQQRVGYTTPFDAKFLLRPNFIGEVLRGLGFGVATTGSAPAYTHTFTIAARNAGAWLSAIILDTDDGGGSFERKFIDCKATKLTVDAGVDEAQDGDVTSGAADGAAALCACNICDWIEACIIAMYWRLPPPPEAPP
jgi:hypothetical protein